MATPPDFYETRSSVPEESKYRLRLLGANGANPTTQVGFGVTVTRTGEGAYRATWAANPGTFLGWSYGFGAATPADLKGYTAVRDTWDSTNLRLDFVVYDSTFAAADLIADQYIDIFFYDAPLAAALIAGLRGVTDILRFVLRLEKESILFYHELLAGSPRPEAKALIEKVIAEERRHVVFIHDKLASLGG